MTALGEYLRARRALLRPADVGLPSTARRRVPGLRREEVALLAGISADYYLQLEQGRDRRPSAEILTALAGALRLDGAATAHLFALTMPAPGRPPPDPSVPPRLLRMLAAWAETPAYVQNDLFDVLAANDLALDLSPLHRPGVNLVREAFRAPLPPGPDPRPDLVACLRGLADQSDPSLNSLVSELSATSGEFRRLWSRHDVRGHTSGRLAFDHPDAGRIELSFERMIVPSAPGRHLVVYTADRDSPSEAALRTVARRARHRSALPPDPRPSPGGRLSR
ncbi:helix-turn-helix domain-containing protein [Actinoplanes sp. G11-F43]|uniref:helix-turn-helix domain-containing protein n=1 Tax=Actinoplanes sp. G11-F43 TaxID=3424130 RepID=UPI003D3513A3